MSALAGARAEVSMRLIVVLYLVSTLVAAIVAAALSFVFPVSLVLAEGGDAGGLPSGVGEVLQALVLNAVANPVAALADANYLGILAWAIAIGVALRKAGETVREVIAAVAEAVSQVVRWIIALAPFGVLGLVYTSVYENGPEIFSVYGRLIALLVGSMLLIALVTNPLLVWLVIRRNPYRLVLRCLKDSGLMAFFTRSSAANIPVNMELARRLGLDRDTYSVSVPLGATVNMAGAAVTITVMALAAAHTVGVRVDFPTAVILCMLAAVSAAGASGVPGGSLMLIPLACSLFGLTDDVAMQVVGIGFIIGVVQDSCETALNSSSDVLLTATAEYRHWNKEGRKYKPGELVLGQ
jgi:serine/threonine transporter